MKNAILITCCMLMCGCATTPTQPQYVIPESIQNRIAIAENRVLSCIKPTKYIPCFITPSKQPAAAYFIDENRIVLSEGLFQFSDDALCLVLAHEIAHEKLGHAEKQRGASAAVTGVMLFVNALIPGAGLLNHVINPAVVNNYSKTQEAEADLEAYRACLCMGISKERVIAALADMKAKTADAGGFWDRHPSWNDRIAAITNAP